ncbi:MAG: MmgE/PrpD family protein [Clostridia bacterium]|nr:MmgE/PrpD family protein [Clostridia bacterium]
MSLSRIIAEFVKNPAPFTDQAIYLAKRSIIDSWGAMVIGAETKCVQMAESVLPKGGNCTVIGSGHKVENRDAAFINGVSGHELELDDTSSSNLGHPTIIALPALIALAEERGCTGKKFLEAFLVTTEVECKVGRIIAKELHKNGWHCTTITGVIGVAAGCAYMMDLDLQKTQYAIGIAASLACGVRDNFGTQTKSIHVGSCCELGLKAALLAEAGFTSSETALEGKEGYIYEYGRIRAEGDEFEKILLSMGHDWDICAPGFTLKRWPSCSSTHRPTDAIMDVIARDGIKVEDIERIEAHGEEAKFSVGFQVALFLYGFENMPYNYKPEIIMRPEIQEIINKTFYYEEPKYNDRPSEMGVGPADVIVVTKDGAEHKKTRNFPVGHLTDPISDEGLYEKYMTCTKKFLGEEKAEKLYKKILGLEEVQDIRELVELSY